MQQWHNTTAQASHQSSCLSDSSASDGSNVDDSQQPAESGLEMDGPEYDELVRDVAARIIQTYWRRCKSRVTTVRGVDHVLAPRMDPPLRPQPLSTRTCRTPEPSITRGALLLSHQLLSGIIGCPGVCRCACAFTHQVLRAITRVQILYQSSGSVNKLFAAGRSQYLRSEHSQSRPTSRRRSSSGGGTENMEYLMNRYRGDTGSQSGSKQEQVVMEHAIGILRAAGMHVRTGAQNSGSAFPCNNKPCLLSAGHCCWAYQAC